jgi:hypothetical protein
MPIISTMKSFRPVKRDCGEERQHHRHRNRDEDDDDAVLHVHPEERLVNRGAEVGERRMRREPRRRAAVDLVGRLERRRDHPEDREDHDDEEREPDDVPACAIRAAARHSTSPIRTILRT